MDKKTVRDLDVAGKKVLVRVDFNVPFDDKGNISDDTRIRASLETIKYLLEHKAAVILMAHLGRPKGQVNPKYSLAPVAKHLGKLLSKKILFAADCVGPEAKAAAKKLKAGHVLLLENLRFHKEEEKNDMEFAEQLASLADLYVNDGFGVSHRAHASVEGVTHFLPAAAGFLLEKEIEYVGRAVTEPLHPFAAIIGGAKVSDKIGVINNLLDKVDTLLIGGGMANTFLAAQGCAMGKSLVEEDKIELARELLAKAKKNKVNLLLPTDLVMAEAFAADAKHVNEDIKYLNQDYMALDIGAETAKAYAAALADAKMIVWNGPMGVFEMDAFCKGTEAVAKAVARSRAVSIVGGGDSVAAVEKLGLAKRISHISTGGGASLEYLEGKVLPGVAAMETVRKNHSLMMSPDSQLGKLHGNPVYDDQIEGVRLFAKEHKMFLFNVILDAQKQFLKIFAGHWETAHLEACKFVEQVYGAPIEQPADIVIASCGGYPKDINIYQLQKTMDNAWCAVKEGGVVIILGECEEGSGSAALEKALQEHPSPDAIKEQLARNFVIGAHKAFAITRLMKKAHFILVSALDKKLAKDLLFEAVDDVDEAIALAEKYVGPDYKILLMPQGSLTVPVLKK